MQLLIAVVNQEEMLEEILSGFLEIGVTGATVVRSEGMGRMLASQVPIFAGLTHLAALTRPRNQMLFSVIDDDAKVDAAMALMEQVCGGLDRPATGIAFTVPVSRAIGLARELPDG